MWGITWRTDEKGTHSTADEVRGIGRRAEVRRLDLTELPQAADVVDELADTLGGVDVLVNNAGTGVNKLLLDLDYDTWRKVLATDLDAAFMCLQRAARRMLDAGRGSRIVNITSVQPGEIATPMTGQENVDAYQQHRAGVPLGPPRDAREIAAVVAFLCSPAASYVTGAT
jgi:NAD(P)-dependent dehydrogenase (short-subunit alcohol dehydrogenase family)